MSVKLYRLDWQGHSAYLRGLDEAFLSELGRFLGLEPVLEESTPAGVIDNLISVEQDKGGEQAGTFHIITRDWQTSAISHAQLLFATLEAIGQIFVYDLTGAIFHAGAFLRDTGGLRDPKAIVFFGAPQSGKSTLGFAAWRRGLALVGDDRIALMEGGRRLCPFLKCLKLRLPADGALPPGLENAPPRLMVKADIGYEIRLILARSLPGFCAYGQDAEVDIVVELKRGAAGETALSPLDPGVALDAAFQNVVSPEFDSMGMVRMIKHQSAENRLFRLTIGPNDSEKALDLLRAL
jgi:hypothetical protein